jgi:hypothetical protein
MRVVLAVLSVLATVSLAQGAGLFLTSDPYPLTGDQPVSGTCQFDGGTPVTAPVVKDATGAAHLSIALPTLPRALHTAACFVTDAAGLTSATTTANFDTTGPGAPVNIRLSPTP